VQPAMEIEFTLRR